MTTDRSKIEQKLRSFRIGRVQVMALLQAARYYVLTGDLEKAKSFGLNRAIFYAWAKYHGPRGKFIDYRKVLEVLSKERRRMEDVKDKTRIEEEAPRGPRGYFMIGDKEQKPWEFDDQILRKISFIMDPDKAWKLAVEYVKQFPSWILQDPQRFYKLVYEPVRDHFFVEIALGRVPKPPKDIAERIRSLDELLKPTKQARLFEGNSSSGQEHLIIRAEKQKLLVNETVKVNVFLNPNISCLCLDHKWKLIIRDMATGDVVYEEEWRAGPMDEYYRGKSLEWRPRREGRYIIEAELQTHGQKASLSIEVSSHST